MTASSKQTFVMRGEQFQFVCNASKEIDACSITFEHIAKGLRVREITKGDEYEYFGRGYKKGDCGIRYFNTTLAMQGNVTCRVGFADDDREIFESTLLKVGIQPTTVELVELHASNKNFEFLENDDMIFNCTAPGAVPPPHIAVFIGNK